MSVLDRCHLVMIRGKVLFDKNRGWEEKKKFLDEIDQLLYGRPEWRMKSKNPPEVIEEMKTFWPEYERELID